MHKQNIRTNRGSTHCHFSLWSGTVEKEFMFISFSLILWRERVDAPLIKSAAQACPLLPAHSDASFCSHRRNSARMCGGVSSLYHVTQVDCVVVALLGIASGWTSLLFHSLNRSVKTRSLLGFLPGTLYPKGDIKHYVYVHTRNLLNANGIK